MKIIIGSKNPAKISAVQAAFSDYEADIMSEDVPSGVNDQPFSDEETIKGAINRAFGALEISGGQIGIGLEGGVQKQIMGFFSVTGGSGGKRKASDYCRRSKDSSS